MRLNRNNGRVITTLLCATALGMWMGACWHAAVHQLEDFAEDFNRICELRQADPAGRVEAVEQHDCPVCQVGLSAPEIQSSVAFILLPELAVRAVPAWAIRHADPVLVSLPLQRGPPTLS